MLKKLISSVLTLTMLFATMTFNVFASSTPNKSSFTVKSLSSGTVELVNSVFGKTNGYKVTKSSGNYKTFTFNETFTSVALEKGQKIKLSLQVAGDPFYASGVQFTAGPKVTLAEATKALDKNGNTKTELAPSMFINKPGAPSSNTQSAYFIPLNVPSNINTYVIPNKTWVTYDMVVTVGETNNTWSLYTNGQAHFEDVAMTYQAYDKNSYEYSKITSLTGLDVRLTHRADSTVYVGDVSLTVYPADYSGNCVDAYPLTDLGNKLEKNTDGSLSIKDFSVTESEIEDMAPNGWTYTYSDGNEDNAVDSGYLIMTNAASGTTYYAKLTSEPVVLYSNDMSTIWTEDQSAYYYSSGVRIYQTALNRSDDYTGGGRTTNKYLKLSKTGLENEKLYKVLFSSATNGTAPNYSTMAETGRIAYEYNLNLPTRDLAFKCGSTFGGGDVNLFEIDTDGKLTLNVGTENEMIAPYTIKVGEWNKFTVIADTTNKNYSIYINGILLDTVELETLSTAGRMFFGYEPILAGEGNTLSIGMSLDDLYIAKVNPTWAPEKIVFESDAVNNNTGIIKGNFDSADAFNGAVTTPEGITLSFYADEAYTQSADFGNYVIAKNTDETLIRYYTITNKGFEIDGFDLDGVTNEIGTKKLTVSIENYEDNPQNVVVFLAGYKNGAMVALSSSKEIQVNPRDKVNLELSFDVTEEAVDEIKAFIWESFSSITPVKVSVNNK